MKKIETITDIIYRTEILRNVLNSVVECSPDQAIDILAEATKHIQKLLPPEVPIEVTSKSVKEIVKAVEIKPKLLEVPVPLPNQLTPIQENRQTHPMKPDHLKDPEKLTKVQKILKFVKEKESVPRSLIVLKCSDETFSEWEKQREQKLVENVINMLLADKKLLIDKNRNLSLRN